MLIVPLQRVVAVMLMLKNVLCVAIQHPLYCFMLAALMTVERRRTSVLSCIVLYCCPDRAVLLFRVSDHGSSPLVLLLLFVCKLNSS